MQCRGDSRTPDAFFCMCSQIKCGEPKQWIESLFRQKFTSRITTMLTWSNSYHNLSICEQFIFSQVISLFFFFLNWPMLVFYISSIYWPILITIISYFFKFHIYVNWLKLIYKTKSSSEIFAYDWQTNELTLFNESKTYSTSSASLIHIHKYVYFFV